MFGSLGGPRVRAAVPTFRRSLPRPRAHPSNRARNDNHHDNNKKHAATATTSATEELYIAIVEDDVARVYEKIEEGESN